MDIDPKMLELARQVKDEPVLKVYGPDGEKTTVVRVDNDCLSNEGRELLGLPTESKEFKEMDRVSQAFAEAGVKLSEAAGAFARAMQVWVEDVWTPALETASKAFSQLAEAWSEWYSKDREKQELIHKALVYGLYGKVVHLTNHKKKRVRKKNLSRLRRMVARYERSHPSCGSCGNTLGTGL